MPWVGNRLLNIGTGILGQSRVRLKECNIFPSPIVVPSYFALNIPQGVCKILSFFPSGTGASIMSEMIGCIGHVISAASGWHYQNFGYMIIDCVFATAFLIKYQKHEGLVPFDRKFNNSVICPFNSFETPNTSPAQVLIVGSLIELRSVDPLPYEQRLRPEFIFHDDIVVLRVVPRPFCRHAHWRRYILGPTTFLGSANLNSRPGGTIIFPCGTLVLSTCGSGGAEALFMGGILDADSIKYFTPLCAHRLSGFYTPDFSFNILRRALTFLPSDKGIPPGISSLPLSDLFRIPLNFWAP
ncbi:hypothetical protein EDD22DRAFT_855855 [Suillus occidentalis]|nr:hypothetical protein EDD22DRAFT_855855 [Suillus occidentalis]